MADYRYASELPAESGWYFCREKVYAEDEWLESIVRVESTSDGAWYYTSGSCGPIETYMESGLLCECEWAGPIQFPKPEGVFYG